jgi:hypothetical protein
VSDWEERSYLDDLAEEHRTIEVGGRRGTGGLREFRVTFGQKYRSEEHPRWQPAHPAGWLTIVASSYAVARAWTVRELGTSWCDIYGPGPDLDLSLFALGELGRFGVDDKLSGDPERGDG